MSLRGLPIRNSTPMAVFSMGIPARPENFFSKNAIHFGHISSILFGRD